MSKNKPNRPIPNQNKYSVPKGQLKTAPIQGLPVTNSLLDIMQDNREFESILHYTPQNVSTLEIKRALNDISNLTNRYTISYLSNFVNQNIKANTSINSTDDLPFREMIDAIPNDIKEIDIVLVTPGGSGEQIAKFVDKLRPRFDHVRFILPDSAMSAGTIFVMSGDEIIMTPNSYIGPIDPQVMNKDGRLVPAQSILALIEEIKNKGNEALKKGLQPDWTDLQILNRLDQKDIGSAIVASNFSIQLVKDYLMKYKFKSWSNHKTSNLPVTNAEKEASALEIAKKFCDHTYWKSHARGITREIAWQECKLQIVHAEEINDLPRAIRRFWAVVYWLFENTLMYKCFVSPNYSLIRQDVSLLNNQKN